MRAPQQYVSTDAAVTPASRTASRQMWAVRRQAMETCGLRFSLAGVEHDGHCAPYHRALKLFGRLLKLSGLYALGHRNAKTVQRRRFDFCFPTLPTEFDKFRILHLSDLHIDKFGGLDDAIIEAAKGLQPDICVMTGDFRAEDDGPFEQIIPSMARLLEAVDAKQGTYAVLGNHDDHALGLALEDRLGVRLLANEQVSLNRGSQRIRIAGADDVNRFYTPDALDALSETHGDFSIALVHSPELAHEASESGFSLYLCGHTHGGQVCLPGGKPMITHLKRNKNLASGLWQVGDMQGYTTTGAGVSGPPVRFFSQSEVALIELHKTVAALPDG